jgi:hypothetical protein
LKDFKILKRLLLFAAVIAVLALGIQFISHSEAGGAEEALTSYTPVTQDTETSDTAETNTPEPESLEGVTALSAVSVTVKCGFYRTDIAPYEPDGNIEIEYSQLGFKLDGREELLKLGFKRVGDVVDLKGIGSDDRDSWYDNITRVGKSNKFVFMGRHGIDNNLYMLDFEDMTISEALPHEDDGYTREDFTELYGLFSWAVNPCISPDGRLMVYLTNRFGYRYDIRVYDFETGEDKPLLRICILATE